MANLFNKMTHLVGMPKSEKSGSLIGLSRKRRARARTRAQARKVSER